MGVIDEVKKFFGVATPQPRTVGFQPVKVVGNYAPFIGADDKTRYIRDFEKVKYAYAVISWIAKKAAKVPFALFRKLGDGTRELVLVNQLLNLIEKPNEYQTRFEFLYQFYGYLLSTGAGYIYMPKLSSGRFAEMHVIPSDFVEPVYLESFKRPASFIIKDSGMTIQGEDMFYIYLPQLKYEQVGVGQAGHSPMKSLITVLQKTSDIEMADLAAIQNGGVAGIITDKSTDAWTAEQGALVENKMIEKAYGPKNKGRFLVTSGDISFIPIGLSPIDLNLFESDKKVLEDICIAYHVPYMIFRQDNTNQSFGTAMSEARKTAYTDAILPIVEMMVDAMNAYGLDGFGAQLVLDYDTSQIEELGKDAKQLAETLAIQWWKTIGQKQRETGMEVDPQFENVYMLPTGLTRLEDMALDELAAQFGEMTKAIIRGK